MNKREVVGGFVATKKHRCLTEYEDDAGNETRGPSTENSRTYPGHVGLHE